MLGTRAVVTMPGVIQSDQVKSEASSDSANTSEAALNDSEEGSDGSVESDSSATSPDAGSKQKKRVPQKPGRKAKKGRGGFPVPARSNSQVAARVLALVADS